MALLDDVREAVRVVSHMTDGELSLLVDAALADMRRVGVRDDLLSEEGMHPMVRFAAMEFVKANYGNDNAETEKWWERYRWAVSSLVNSSMNECVGGDVT